MIELIAEVACGLAAGLLILGAAGAVLNLGQLIVIAAVAAIERTIRR